MPNSSRPETITFEVTVDDTADPPKGYTPLKGEWVDDPDGPMTIEAPPPHVLKDGEGWIGGETFLARSKEQVNRRGLRAANALVRQQDKIPVALRGNVVFVFKGAVAKSPNNIRMRMFAYLIWNGRRWMLDWSWRGDGWNG